MGGAAAFLTVEASMPVCCYKETVTCKLSYSSFLLAHAALTLPAVVADAQLLPCEVAVAMVGASAVVPAVGDVTGLTFPVLVTFTVHSASSRVPWSALPMARAVIRTRVDPGQKYSKF